MALFVVVTEMAELASLQASCLPIESYPCAVSLLLSRFFTEINDHVGAFLILLSYTPLDQSYDSVLWLVIGT